MTATETDTTDDYETRGMATTAQTHFDARDVLTGDVDDTTVRQAVEAGDRQ